MSPRISIETTTKVGGDTGLGIDDRSVRKCMYRIFKEFDRGGDGIVIYNFASRSESSVGDPHTDDPGGGIQPVISTVENVVDLVGADSVSTECHFFVVRATHRLLGTGHRLASVEMSSHRLLSTVDFLRQ